MQRGSTILSTLILAAWAASTAQATITYSIEPATVVSGQGDVGDWFDVIVSNSAGGTAVTIGGFEFEVSVTDPDITLTGADFSTVEATYIFAGQSLDEDSSTPLSTGSGLTIDASDFSDGSGATLDPGDSLALGHVLFNVAANATLGSFSVTFTGGTGSSGANVLLDTSFNQINIDTLSGGTIDITPEPSSAALLLAGFTLLYARRKRRAA